MRSKSLGTRVGPLTRIPWGAFQILKSHLGGLGIRILFKVPNVVGPSGVARYTGSWRIASSRIKFTCVCCCSPDRSRRRRVVGEVESCYVDEDEGGALVRPLRSDDACTVLHPHLFYHKHYNAMDRQLPITRRRPGHYNLVHLLRIHRI